MAWARRSFPAWVWIWSLVSIFLAYYDAIYVLLRPLSTDLWIYKDYVQAYPPVDASYKNDNLHDGLPYAIAIIGALLNHTVILFSLLLMVCSKPIAAKLLLFGANCMVIATSAVFILSHALCMTPAVSGEPGASIPQPDVHILSVIENSENFWCHTSHNDPQTFYSIFLVPNILYVVIPFVIARALWKDITSMTYATARYNEKKSK